MAEILTGVWLERVIEHPRLLIWNNNYAKYIMAQNLVFVQGQGQFLGILLTPYACEINREEL